MQSVVPGFQLKDVSVTSLLTLYCHALDAESDDPILDDVKSIRIAVSLDRILAASDDEMAISLVNRRLKTSLVVHIAMRAKRYDQYVQDFLSRFPEGTVVNIGCGLDSRFFRIDNGKVRFYDLDLPEVIALKKQFFEETDRYHLIPSSVLEDAWMQMLPGNSPALFLAEGVFMYLPPGEVKSLVRKLQEHFPGCELVGEVVQSSWLKEPFRRLVVYKQRKLHFGDDAGYQSGLRHSREMEEWNPGIEFLDDWSYLDSYERRLGWLKILRNIRFIRFSQWTVHYRLN
jgi:O-methyltransferase involved in polyketide biosynthesis